MSGFFEPERPRVIAHRGLALGGPENTLLSFQHAVRAGASYLELDVHASSDGVAVVSHDADLRRMANLPGSLAALSFAELQGIDLGDGQSFSSLGEVLEAFPSARLNIDIKAMAAVKPTVAAVRLAHAHNRVLITSFSERRRSAAVRQLPGVATSASSTLFAVALLAATLRLQILVRRALRDVDAVQIPLRAGGISVATPRMVTAFHAANVEIHMWTINDRATMERLLDLGIDGLVTDRADVAVHLLKERSSPDHRT